MSSPATAIPFIIRPRNPKSIDFENAILSKINNAKENYELEIDMCLSSIVIYMPYINEVMFEFITNGYIVSQYTEPGLGSEINTLHYIISWYDNDPISCIDSVSTNQSQIIPLSVVSASELPNTRISLEDYTIE